MLGRKWRSGSTSQRRGMRGVVVAVVRSVGQSFFFPPFPLLRSFFSRWIRAALLLSRLWIRAMLLMGSPPCGGDAVAATLCATAAVTECRFRERGLMDFLFRDRCLSAALRTIFDTRTHTHTCEGAYGRGFVGGFAVRRELMASRDIQPDRSARRIYRAGLFGCVIYADKDKRYFSSIWRKLVGWWGML